MCDELLLHQLLKNPIAKMCTSITNDFSRHTKPSKNSVLQKFDHNSVVIGLARNCFHPFGHIVHSNQNIQITKEIWERSHEINAPHTENLNNKYWIEGHHVPLCNTPQLLTALTRCAISTSVSKHGRPIKSKLQNLCNGLICTEMASACMIMTKGDHIGLVKLKYTPPNDLIGTILEQIRIILEKGLHFGQKFELILLPPRQRHLAGDKIVHDVHIPRCGIVSNLHQLLIRKGLRNGGCVLGVIHGQSRQMIYHHIFGTFLIPNFYVKLLK
jgi:hypothetical protein